MALHVIATHNFSGEQLKCIICLLHLVLVDRDGNVLQNTFKGMYYKTHSTFSTLDHSYTNKVREKLFEQVRKA